MDYESRQVKWYWLLLFILYSGAVVYLLFTGNPYLYSHRELRAALTSGEDAKVQTMPSIPHLSQKLGPPTFQWRYNWGRSAVDNLGTARSKNWVEFKQHPVDFDLGSDRIDIQNVTSDTTGFFVSGKMRWVAAVDLNGKTRWKFHFRSTPQGRSLLPVLLDDINAYLVHPEGEIVCLNKETGELQWLMSTGQDVVAQPFIWGEHLGVPIKGTTGIELRLIDRHTGQPKPENPHLDIKPGFLLSFSEELKTLIVSVDNKVISIDPENWAIVWSQTLTEPVRGPAVIVDQSIFITTLAGKLVKIDGRKGKVDWEIDLEKSPSSSPSYLPILQRLAFLDIGGGLNAVDIKTGKLLWRNSLENRNPLVETWSARLKGNHIEEFGMDWMHKGWTIWSPCSERRFCILTPAKGQLIARIELSAAPLALPQNIGRHLVFFGQSKPGKYVISHLLEQSEIKRLSLGNQSAND
jgi:outer membrane protein assembly factor BamB